MNQTTKELNFFAPQRVTDKLSGVFAGSISADQTVKVLAGSNQVFMSENMRMPTGNDKRGDNMRLELIGTSAMGNRQTPLR